MLRVRLKQHNITAPIQIAAQINLMLPPELAAGLPLDLNRPFGNGRDDSPAGSSGYGIVDEAGEVELAYWNTTSATAPSTYAGIKPNLTNGIDVNRDNAVNDLDKMLARQLYVAASIRVDDVAEGPNHADRFRQ